MTKTQIEIGQTLHGYDGGHRLLASSMKLAPQDERALLAMSDLSGPRVAENFLEYLTGYMLPGGTHYAFAKTWYATEMERPGCVWTHTFLIPRESIRVMRSIAFLQDRFFRPRLKSGYRYADPYFVDETEAIREVYSEITDIEDDSVRCGILALYSRDDATVGLPAKSGLQFQNLSAAIWAQLWPELRYEFSFCTGSLSIRSLQGKPLMFQCGPDRVIRDYREEVGEDCAEAAWLDAVIEDLRTETQLRKFFRENGPGLTNRVDPSRVAKIYTSLSKKSVEMVLDLLTARDFELGVRLGPAVIKDLARLLPPFDFLEGILNNAALPNIVSLSAALETAVLKSLEVDRHRTVALFSDHFARLGAKARKTVIGVLAEHANVEFVVWISDAFPDLYNAITKAHLAVVYQPSLWNSSLSLLDKIELFDRVRSRKDIDTRRLFGAVLQSHDLDLSAEVVTHLTDLDLSAALDWLLTGDWTVALRPQWLAYLRRFQPRIIEWASKQQPSATLVLILANIVDIGQSFTAHFDESFLQSLIISASSLISERNEVAAFVYVATTSTREAVASKYCCGSFAILHLAIAESRLSNRAWQILEPNLVDLPYEQWDACEKLRRAILHFLFLHKWPVEDLWILVSQNTNLFHDFIRTAKSFRPGKAFFAEVSDAGTKGFLQVNKQQFKEIRKLLR